MVSESTGLYISGLIRTNLDRSRLARSEVQRFTRVHALYPRVTSPAPGVLHVGANDEDIAHYAHGEQLMASIGLFWRPGPVLEQLGANAASHFSNLGSRAGDLYARMVGRVVQRVVDLQHGGAVVILPQETVPVDIDIKYQPTIGSDIRNHFLNWSQALIEQGKAESAMWHAAGSGRDRPRLDAEERAQRNYRSWHTLSHFSTVERYMYDAASAAGDLANVDGALILGPSLSLCGFGGMIRWDESPISIHQASDPAATERSDFDLRQLGSRHRSAAWLCHRHPGAVAFVVSEDGPLSCIMRPHSDDHVLIWRPASISSWDGTRPPRPLELSQEETASTADTG